MADVKTKYLTVHVLPVLRALYQLLQHFHWKTEGDNYYSDHQLFERLYEDVQEELDRAAEKIIGLHDSDAIGAGEEMNIASSLVEKFTTDDADPKEFPERAIKAEQFFIDLIDHLMSKLKDEDGPTDGLENMLQEFADKHEEHLYLLKQRNKTEAQVKKLNVFYNLAKLSNRLDEKGLYDEADEVDSLIRTAADVKIPGSADELERAWGELDESGREEMLGRMQYEPLDTDADRWLAGKEYEADVAEDLPKT